MAGTAHRTGSGGDNTLQTLQARLKGLGVEYEGLRQEYDRVYAQHARKCSSSLQASVKSLLEVLVFVRKADKKLVDWHHRSDGVKNALRYIGINRHTESMIEKNTHKLQDRVQRVEKKFDKTGHILDGGLQDARRMKSGFREFSTGNVENSSQQLLTTLDAYEQEFGRFDAAVHQQSAEHKNAQSEAESLTKSLEAAEQEHDGVDQSRRVWTAGTILGFGATAASAFFFPPSLLTTAPLLVASFAAGSNAMSYTQQTNDLAAQKESLSSSFNKHKASARAIKAELEQSTKNRKAYETQIADIDNLIGKNEKFRADSQRSLDEIYRVQTLLEKIQGKIQSISRELNECQYEVSRRGIAGRLRDILGGMQQVPKKIESIKPSDVTKATRELLEIDERTPEVLRIAAAMQG